jgi:hypothetical protein
MRVQIAIVMIRKPEAEMVEEIERDERKRDATARKTR